MEYFEDDESEDDEDFEDDAGSDDEDEDGEDDQYGSQADAGSDSDMIDEEVDKKELAHLKKDKTESDALPQKRKSRGQKKWVSNHTYNQLLYILFNIII